MGAWVHHIILWIYKKEYLKENLDSCPFRVGIKAREDSTDVDPRTPECCCVPQGCKTMKGVQELSFYIHTKRPYSCEVNIYIVQIVMGKISKGHLSSWGLKGTWKQFSNPREPLKHRTISLFLWSKSEKRSIFSCFLILQDLRRLSLSLLVGTL